MIKLISVFLAAFLLSSVGGAVFIPFLKKIKIGQPILKYVDKHAAKSGTPTMGGVIFILAAAISYLIFARSAIRLSLVALFITLGFMIVGMTDDYIKIKTHNNAGLTAWQKASFQLVVAVISAIAVYKSGGGLVYLPYSLKIVDIKKSAIILNVFVFVATTNAVNLTDGLDGLCASVSVFAFLGLSAIIAAQLHFNKNAYVSLTEYYNLILLSVSIVGALSGYLIFNTQKACVFMGDSGSLALGGGLSAVAVFSLNTLYVPFIGIIFVLTAVSVIIQVLHYKRTKKRVFLMAPFHHHLELKGLSEAKIAYIYSIITVISSLFAVLAVLIAA